MFPTISLSPNLVFSLFASFNEKQITFDTFSLTKTIPLDLSRLI